MPWNEKAGASVMGGYGLKMRVRQDIWKRKLQAFVGVLV